MARIGAYLEKHGRKLIGWDEILEGQVPADATVMSWRGIDGAITAAKAGHDTVLSPAPTLYFNYRSSTSPDEPGAQGTLVDWRTLYAFDPAPAELIPAERRPIIGQTGRAHVCTPVANTHLVCRLLLAKKKTQITNDHHL